MFFLSLNSEFVFPDSGERDRDLDGTLSLSSLLSRSLALSISSLLPLERNVSDVFVPSPLTRSIIG